MHIALVEREQCLILESEHPQLKEEMFRCLMEQYVWEWPQLYLVIRFVDTASAAASLPQTKNSTEEVAQELPCNVIGWLDLSCEILVTFTKCHYCL